MRVSFRGWQWAIHAQTQKGAEPLFSLEVKTQTKAENAKGHATGLFFISVFVQQQHHTAAGRDKQRDARGDRQAGGKSTVNSML